MKRTLYLLLALFLSGLFFSPAESFLANGLEDEPPYVYHMPFISKELGFFPRRLGPDVGRVLGVGQDASSTSMVYAMTFGSGMYRSLDGGGSWEPASAGLTNLALQSIAVDPVTPYTVYVGTYGSDTAPYSGVFKTTDGGASWRATGEMANIWNGVRYNKPVVYALAVDRLNPNRVFAGTRMKFLPSGYLGGGGVFRSENGGATWTPVNNGLPNEDLYVYDLTLDPAHPGRVYAALHQHGLYRSDNYGASWSAVGGTPYAGRAVAVDPYNSATIYFGAVKKLGLHRSFNEGGSWSQIGDGGWDSTVGGLSVDPLRPGVLFSGVLVDNENNYLMRSDNNGSSWRVAAQFRSGTWGRIAFSPDGQQALIGVDFDGPYRSSNGGQTWARSVQGLTGFSVTGLAISPADPNRLYACVNGIGYFGSYNQGASWWRSVAGMGNENNLALAVDPSNPSTVYVTTDQSAVYRSTDGGQSWGALSGGYPTAAAPGVMAEERDLSPFANRPLPELDTLKDDPDAPAAPSLIAANGLATGNTIAVSPFSSSVVLVGTAGRGIYRLNGSSWAASSLSVGTVYNILFDRVNPGRALAAVSSAAGGVLASSNNGQTWQASNTGLAGRTVYSLAQSAAAPAIFLAGTDSGVFQSADGGRTWSSAGMAGYVVKAVGLLPGYSGLMFAGTDSAAYYYHAGRDAWVSIGKPLENVGIQGILSDPSGQALYFHTRLGGVVRVEVR